MVTISTNPTEILISSVETEPKIIFLSYKSGFKHVSKTALLKKGLSVFSIKAYLPNSVEFEVFPLSKKLEEGEHDSPPKGDPSDKEDYAVPEFYLFPINDEEHVRAAIGYFSKHPWKPEEHKEEAAKRILSAAKKFGIEVSEDSDVYKAAHESKKSLAEISELLESISRFSWMSQSAFQESIEEGDDPRDKERSHKYNSIIENLFDISVDHLEEEKQELQDRLNSLTKSTEISKKIKEIDGKYYVYNHTGKKRLSGPYDSHEEAGKRLGEIEWFKEHDK